MARYLSDYQTFHYTAPDSRAANMTFTGTIGTLSMFPFFDACAMSFLLEARVRACARTEPGLARHVPDGTKRRTC
jgi:hypothetical protein